ncbi:connectin-like isoform X2 [Planococcus citri]
MRALFSIHIWLSVVLVVCSTRRQDKKKFHHKFSEPSNVDETINICDLQTFREINVQCHCDSETYSNATEAKCWIFNEGEKEDSFIWEEFRSQPKLRILEVNVRSTLTYVPTKALSNLAELSSFTLMYGNITRIVPYAFANLTSLERLELKHNNVEVLEKYSVSNLPSMKEITLSNNAIKEISRDIFKNLPSLKRLYIEENSINVVQDLAFSELRNLEELEMHRNQITAISRNTFAGLMSLKRLDLHSNLLSELKDFTFAEMPNLVELFVDQNMIESVGEKVFYALKRLDRLVMAENKLHILPDNVFVSLPHLRVLDLRDNLLQTFTYDTASPILDKLKNESFYFHIEGNRLECDCNLSWIRTLANETANTQLRSKLQQLSCYMKGDYYTNDDSDQEINTNGLTDSRLLREGALSSSRNLENMPENVDRMLKLFNIPAETLPCPEKRQANENPLMEQMSKNERASGSPCVLLNFKLFTCLFLMAAFVL